MTRIAVPAKQGWLDQLFMLRQMVELRLDACFAHAPLPAGAEVLLFNEADAGFGDIAFATRLLGLIRGRLPEVQLTLVSSRPDKQRVFGLPAGVKLYGFDAFEDPEQRPALRPDLVISAPGIFDHCRFAAPIYERLGLDAATPFLYLAEYGSIRQLRDDALKARMPAIGAAIEAAMDRVAQAQGLDPDAMGYRGRSGEMVGQRDGQMAVVGLLAEHLVAAGGPLHDLLCAPILSARSCGVQVAEIGIHIDAELRAASAAPSAGLLQDLADPALRALRPGADGAALYCGYAHSGVGRFVDIIAVLEGGRDVDVIAPNAREPAGTWQEDFDLARQQRLRDAGFGRVHIVGNGPDAEVFAEPHELGEGATLRLITCHPIGNADWRRLLLASAPPTMVTGDQSFSDAVSAGKAIAIMEPVYCKTWHLDAWLELAEVADPELAALLRFSMAARWQDADWQRVRAFVACGGLLPAARRLNHTLIHEHDASETMIRAICRRYWTARRPELAQAQRDLLMAAWRHFDGVTGLPVDRGALAALTRLARTAADRPWPPD